MPSHFFTPRPPTEAETAFARQQYPEFCAWLDTLTDDERAGLALRIDTDDDGALTMTWRTDAA